MEELQEGIGASHLCLEETEPLLDDRQGQVEKAECAGRLQSPDPPTRPSSRLNNSHSLRFFSLELFHNVIPSVVASTPLASPYASSCPSFGS